MTTAEKARNALLDFDQFAPRWLKIEALDRVGHGHLVPLTLNRAQQYYRAHRTERNVTVKARQIGFSTGLLASNFHRAITVPQTEAALITHKEEISSYMLGIVGRFRNNLKDEKGNRLTLTVGIDSMDQFQVVFDAGDNGHFTSSIFVGTAGSKIFGRAQSFNVLHLTEVAHWAPEKLKGILSGVLNSMPSGASVDVESTPNGRDNWFYDMYQAAKRGEEPYTPFFFPWWWCDNYSLPASSPLVVPDDRIVTPTPEEKDLVRQHKLTDDQLRWRRWKFREQDKIQKDLFRQEYPENDVDCWLTSSSIFDVQALQAASRNVIPPLETRNWLTVWKRRRWDRNYVIGVDVGEGLVTGHFTVAAVLDALSGEIVAVLRARVPQDYFTEELVKLGHEYGAALIAVERNYGQGILNLLVKADYPNLYTMRDIIDGETGKLGFHMNRWNRPAVIDSFRAAVSDRAVVIYDTVLIDECMNFQLTVGKDGKTKMAAGGNGYDDTLFAAMIAWFVRESVPALTYRQEAAAAERYA